MSTTICIFGDSITWGATDIDGGGWAGRLRSNLEADPRSDAMVYNLGICGDTTDGLLRRFSIEAEARDPQMIIFAIGINDSAYVVSRNNPQTDLEDFKYNLVQLIDRASEITSRIVFVSLNKVDEDKTAPIPWTADIFYDNENILVYNSVISAVCQENNIQFIDVFDVLELSDLDDGLHPNAAGHEKLFVKIKESLAL
ncbi:hypothetical protein HGA64_03485 [Candidatus Falkowbacteria bacterium]|nr:hypothetical protein [Candidatus Falkowbacteria bacterium]